MKSNQESKSPNKCADCEVFVACKSAKEASEARIAEIEASQFLRERYNEAMGGNLDDDGRSMQLKEFEFKLWVMKNETFKDDSEGLVAALQALSTRYSVDMPLDLAAISDESSELLTHQMRIPHCDVLLDAIASEGCIGPRTERSGFMGRKVTQICQAPIGPVEKILAANPPPTNQ
jgi:hypothetical protein